MRDDLLQESEKLTRSWSTHEPVWLREYLVAGVEDPRLNLQSILSRHFLLTELVEVPGRLMHEEYRFSATLNWLLATPDLTHDAELRAATLHALRNRADNAEGIPIPSFVSGLFKDLPVEVSGGRIPNYLEMALSNELPGRHWWDLALDTFAGLWTKVIPALAKKPACWGADGGGGTVRPSLVEPACGSANDFRFIHRYGIAGLLDYRGFDLCKTNIENARALFPDGRFQQANVFEIPTADQTFDWCIVHDLFEHLSLAGLDQAVREICRITKRAVCLGFFQMDEVPDHVVRPVDDYYWNLLSVDRMRTLFSNHGFMSQVIHIDSFLTQKLGAPPSHNPNAYTFILRHRRETAPAI